MPRRHRRKPDETPRPRVASTTEPLPSPPGWTAQRYRGIDTEQSYVCPRCHRPVTRRSEHVVAWQTESDDQHRHWHSACWASAVREGIDRYRFG